MCEIFRKCLHCILALFTCIFLLRAPLLMQIQKKIDEVKLRVRIGIGIAIASFGVLFAIVMFKEWNFVHTKKTHACKLILNRSQSCNNVVRKYIWFALPIRLSQFEMRFNRIILESGKSYICERNCRFSLYDHIILSVLIDLNTDCVHRLFIETRDELRSRFMNCACCPTWIGWKIHWMIQCIYWILDFQ